MFNLSHTPFFQLAVTAQVRLLPLAEWINLPAEHLCASYITSLFEEPAKHLPNVTLPESYLENCSSIQLTPALLTSNSDLIFYSCAEGFVYDAFNFLCVDGESLSHGEESFWLLLSCRVVLWRSPFLKRKLSV